jgi:hypothetical protein
MKELRLQHDRADDAQVLSIAIHRDASNGAEAAIDVAELGLEIEHLGCKAAHGARLGCERAGELSINSRPPYGSVAAAVEEREDRRTAAAVEIAMIGTGWTTTAGTPARVSCESSVRSPAAQSLCFNPGELTKGPCNDAS